MNSTDKIEEQVETAFKIINRLTNRGRLKKALVLCKELYTKLPNNPRVLQGMGVLSFRNGESEAGEAYLQKAIELKPDYADAHFNLGNIHRSSYRLDKAETALRKALEIDPDHYKALAYLAPVLCKQKKWSEANLFCERAIALQPKSPEAYTAMGTIKLENGDSAQGLACLQKSLSIKPKNETHSSILFNMNLLADYSQENIFRQSLAWGEKYAQPLTAKARPHLNSILPDRKIRLGYVSGDFKFHPVSHHLKPVLAAHDADCFEVYLYSCFPYSDKMTEELAGYARYYRDISTLTDEQAESVIRSDGIDILVDLAGHTAYHRLTLFARKPAPVQVSWLGYFNTTGMAAIDYILSDSVTIPPDQDQWFAEKVVRLPDCRFCYEAPSFAPDVVSSPALKKRFVTFGSFNKLSKLNANVVEAWCRVLAGVPGSKLILKWPSLGNQQTTNGIIEQFSQHGIARDRLLLRPDSPHPEMLAEYGDVDIALDTFPYNGGATTCEALWMGVPVVALSGSTPIGRQSKSFLNAIGHPEWVADSIDNYVQIACQLAANARELTKIRHNLRREMTASSLCDGHGFASHLETAYRKMWHAWCQENEHLEYPEVCFRRFKADELYNCGVINMDDGDHKRAAELFQAVIRRQPHNYQASNNLGICLFNLGHNEEAFRFFKRAIRLNKSDGKAYNNLGRIYLECGQAKSAINYCKKAVELSPEDSDALINYGIALRKNGCHLKAVSVFEGMLEKHPDQIAALINLSNILLTVGQTERCVELLRKALQYHPDNLEIISSLMFNLQTMPGTHQQEIFELATSFESKLPSAVIDSSEQAHDGRAREKEHLRIGFVSNDFKSHPVGRLLLALFSSYNRERLSLYCYSNARNADNITHYYRSTCTGWRDISFMNDPDAAELIKNDNIDILVDLSGHTSGNRLPTFNMKPARLQLSWLGYWHTTGLKAIDFVISDNEHIHSEDERWFVEKVVRLPYNRFCFTPPDPSPFVVESPVVDNEYITFGCFNNLGKINAEVLSAWAEILMATPKSRLVLKSQAFKDLGVKKRFREEFKLRGISPRRIELLGSSAHYLMLAEYGEIDIALDPFPFSGGMTSLEALWMGVPVVTLAGDLPVSRQTKSFLDLVGLQALATTTVEAYIAKAVMLAKEPRKLCEIRESLREQMINSQLCDSQKYAQSVEKLFFDIWRDSH